MEHPQKARVILTHTRDDGVSTFTENLTETQVEKDANGVPVFRVTQLWGTADGIGTVGPGQNPEQVVNPWYPEPGAVRFRFFTFEPERPAGAGDDTHQIQDVQTEDESGFADSFDPERPGMHISDSIDFVHVLSGEVVLELEQGETVVKKGDVVIMRGGWHRWRNETAEPCTVASVMVGTTRN